MKQVIVIAICLLINATAGISDEVRVGRLIYSDVKVTEVTKDRLVFQVGDRTLTKALDRITLIWLEGCQQFNEAERLLSEGNYERALLQYAKVKAQPSRPWIVFLAGRRIELAKLRKTTGNVPAKPFPANKKPKSRKCYYCRGTGLKPCSECGGTGLARCLACKANGWVTCPVCKGNWRKDRCKSCGGAGTREESYTAYQESRDRYYDRQGKRYRTRIRREPYTAYRTVRCTGCGGDGWRWFCPRCRLSAKKRGMIKCPDCGGSRKSGKCPICAGKKKVRCTHCEAGRAATSSTRSVQLAGPDEQRSGSRAENAPQGTVDPLTSLDALAGALASEPPHPAGDAKAWAEMTSLQKQLAEKEYQKKISEWKKTHDFCGKRIRWVVSVQDVASSAGGSEFTVQAVSKTGHVVCVTFPGNAGEMLVRLKKADSVRISGTITEHHFEQIKTGRAGRGTQRLSVKLTGDAVEHAQQGS